MSYKETMEDLTLKCYTLREALVHLLEVQISPSTPHHEEWNYAKRDARKAIRECKVDYCDSNI